MDPLRLRVLVIAAREADSRFAVDVLGDRGDEVTVATDVPAALARLGRERFDVALVGLSLPRGDGLALVHHLRALHPEVDVIALAAPTDLKEAAHAMALGVMAHVLLPLSGDGLLVAIDRARERRALIAERARLSRDEARSRRRNATYARCAAFVAETEAAAVARRVVEACVGEVPARAAAIYLAQSGGSRLRRASAVGEADLLPEAMDEGAFDPTAPVRLVEGRVRVGMLGDAGLEAIVEIVPETTDEDPMSARDALEVVAALGSAAFAAARKVEAIERTGIKDPDTSAYTFAYFGDVAGREIDRAMRHGRRFSLLTVGLDEALDDPAVDPERALQRRRAFADAILESVRDSDVLARVEDDEFYLLLPETGLLGALACRRRIVQRLSSTVAEGVPVVGVAVYPTDGTDLGRLLRVSRRRSERSRTGVWRRRGLAQLPFWDAVEALLGAEDDVGLARDGTIRLHADLRDTHDEVGLARHIALSPHVLAAVGAQLAEDALRHRVAGTMYVAGDGALRGAIARTIDVGGRAPLRAWLLGTDAHGGRLSLPVADPRLDQHTLLLSLTELGGYALVARPFAQGLLLAYHAVDLDVVDGLVSALQQTYHLQPEVRS